MSLYQRQPRQPARQNGLSLVELMIATTLGIILTFGVVEIYVGSKQTYRYQDALSRMQENARFAFDILVRDIRTTGYIGCSNNVNVTPNVVAGTPGIASYTPATTIAGYENTSGTTWSPALPAVITADVANSDVITVQTAGGCSNALTTDMTSNGDDVRITNSCGFRANDVVMIADCAQADIFRITAASATALSHAGLSASYTTAGASDVMRVRSNSYFIRNDVSGIPALFLLDNTLAGATPVALVEGVENMQIQYGVDSTGDGVPETYQNANAITNWAEVVTVRITLLLRTIENVRADDYNFASAGVNYSGGFLRKEFVTTIQLRNRGLDI